MALNSSYTCLQSVIRIRIKSPGHLQEESGAVGKPIQAMLGFPSCNWTYLLAPALTPRFEMGMICSDSISPDLCLKVNLALGNMLSIALDPFCLHTDCSKVARVCTSTGFGGRGHAHLPLNHLHKLECFFHAFSSKNTGTFTVS